jgi:hypothetical protein
VWIGGNGPGDSHILKFTKDGKFLLQIGKPNARQVPGAAPGAKPTFRRGSNDQMNFGRVAKITVDPKANRPTSRTAISTRAWPCSTPPPAR